MRFVTNTSEAVRIDSSGKVGIGTNNPTDGKLVVNNSGQNVYIVAEGGAPTIGFRDTETNHDNFAFQVDDDYLYLTVTANSDFSSQSRKVGFDTTGKITLGGGKSVPAAVLDISSSYGGYIGLIHNQGNHDAYRGIDLRVGQHNPTGTNYAMRFADGDDTEQGLITFSGGTVTYGAFTAVHHGKIPSEVSSSGYDYGTLLQINSIYYSQKNSEDSERGILYDVQATTGSYVRNILGAYAGKHESGSYGDNYHLFNVLGDGHIICNGEKGNIAVGDGICSSTTVGQGMKADKMAMCIGIAQATASFTGSETQLVPVQYGLQQFTPWTD